MIKQLLIIIAGISFSANIFSQEIEWYDLEKGKKHDFNSREMISSTDFFGLTENIKFLNSSYYLSYYERFSQLTRVKLDMKTPTGNGRIYARSMFNGKLTVILGNEKDNVNTLYSQTFGKDCLPDGDLKELVSFTESSKRRLKASINCEFSQKNEFLRISYALPGEKELPTIYNYKTFDKELEEVESGTYEIEDNKWSIIETIFTENNEYYFLVRNLEVVEGKRRDQVVTDFTNVSFIKVEGSELSESQLSLENREVRALSLIDIQNGILTMTGLYSDGKKAMAGSVFYKYDIAQEKLISEGSYEFTKEFLTDDLTEKEKAKEAKREAKGKGNDYSYRYSQTFSKNTTDGGTVVILEKYYMVVVTSTNSKGQTTTTYYYHYEDLIVFKINADGEYVWVKKMDKNQVSANDGGFLSSFHAHLLENNLIIYFNDHKKNYSEMGDFIGPAANKKIVPMSASTKSNVIAKIDFDLEDGKESREVFSSRSENGFVAIPMLFRSDYENNEISVTFTTRKKTKYGVMRF